MTDDEYASEVFRLLTSYIPSSYTAEDMKADREHLKRLHGWDVTVRDAARYLRYTEEISPHLKEDFALAKMRSILDKYPKAVAERKVYRPDMTTIILLQKQVRYFVPGDERPVQFCVPADERHTKVRIAWEDVFMVPNTSRESYQSAVDWIMHNGKDGDTYRIVDATPDCRDGEGIKDRRFWQVTLTEQVVKQRAVVDTDDNQALLAQPLT